MNKVKRLYVTQVLFLRYFLVFVEKFPSINDVDLKLNELENRFLACIA